MGITTDNEAIEKLKVDPDNETLCFKMLLLSISTKTFSYMLSSNELKIIFVLLVNDIQMMGWSTVIWHVERYQIFKLEF
jgi:hypothetical protein